MSEDHTSNHDADSGGDASLQQALRGFVPEANAPIIEEEILIEIDLSRKQHRSDDILLARFFGICVMMIGMLTILPAIYYWVTTAGQQIPGEPDRVQAIARWAYIIGFLGAVHFLYGIYTMQLVDFSSLQMLAGFLLLVTCVYGFTGMSLILDDGNGTVASFLQLPHVMKSRATIWCGIMFGITALGCYLFGREALTWRKRFSARANQMQA